MNVDFKVDFNIDTVKLKADVVTQLEATVKNEFGKVVGTLLSDNNYFGSKLGPVRSDIRKHVETLVLERMTDDQIQADVQRLFDKTYDVEYQKALQDAITRTARRQAQRAVAKLRRSEHEERSAAKV